MASRPEGCRGRDAGLDPGQPLSAALFGAERPMNTALPLRILMVIHTPWSKNLGAPRVQMDLAEEMVRRGHRVEKFSVQDAFPAAGAPGSRGSWGRLVEFAASNRSLAVRAMAYLCANAERFDIVDANQTDLPCPKLQLGFRGLVVARSVGLIPAYDEFERWAARRWLRHRSARELADRALRWLARQRAVHQRVGQARFLFLGPGQRLGGGSTFVFRALLAASGPGGPLMGDGRWREDFLSLDDLVAAMSVNGSFEDPRFKIASGHSYTLRHMLAVIEHPTGRAVPVKPIPGAADDVRHAQFAVDKARGKLGWAARLSFEEAISRFWRVLVEPAERKAAVR